MYRRSFPLVLVATLVLVLLGILLKFGNVQNAVSYDQDWDGAGSSVNWR